MQSRSSIAARTIGLLVLATTLTVGAAGSAAYAQVSVPETVPSVGCGGSVGQVDADAETDDDGGQAGQTEHDPAIVGSVKAPPGAREDDRRLAPLATISPDQARQAALAVLNDASQRQVRRVEIEAENGYVVYAVKTRRTGPGPNLDLEVKVDAGNGSVLMVECDSNDD